ncbi:MAG: cysteine--tRNA ligase [Gammaproteobacteria bacterium]
MLKIYNSLTRQKETFQPIEANKVRMYVCGMTVYDLCHVGHARVMVVFDMIARHLRSTGYEVHYVRNITDIDDKIIKRANENNESISDLTERYIEAMNEDSAALGVLPPDEEPRATTTMQPIIDMISKLIENEHAYVGSNNDVYFDVKSFKEYGKLSGKHLDELRAGERVEVQDEKKDPLDFVLWKAAKPDEPSWSSPWGDGRPGWHIECSAMSTQCLGNHFDIHGGGQDLQFPHHENEIAQSECATGEKFVNTWIHNGFVRIDEEKMSKSLGNFFTVREVLKQFQPEVVRFFILSSHYRSPLNYSQENLGEARAALTRLYTALRDATDFDSAGIDQTKRDQFNEYMNDDFNTPKSIALLHELARELNKVDDKSSEKAKSLARTLKSLAEVLGLLQDDPRHFLQSGSASDADGEEIEKLIQARADAKAAKDYATADQIRDQLTAMNISLEDTAQGTIWRRN